MINWHIDVEYSVHWYFRIHTGGTLSLETGSILIASLCQNLNTKNSNNPELVGLY